MTKRLELSSSALVAARRFAAVLVAEGEDLSTAERVVVTRALHHQLGLAFRELGIVEPAEPETSFDGPPANTDDETVPAEARTPRRLGPDASPITARGDSAHAVS